jgi:Zn-dependent protease
VVNRTVSDEKTTSKPSALSRMIEFFGLRKSIVGLLGMVILVGMGEHMAEQFLPLYLLALGGGFISVGFLNGMDNLLGALYSFPGGYLSDRLGTKRALLVFNLIPIPPLDGSKILMGFLPTRQQYALSRLEPYGFFIIIGLLYFGALDPLINLFRWMILALISVLLP